MDKCRIILVDDDCDDVAFLKYALEQTQSVIVHAVCCNYGELMFALEHFSAPDLIICDINLPGKTGIDICREFYEAGTYHSIPLVLMTGAAPSEAVTSAARQYNVAAVLVKPHGLSDYKELADRLLAICREAR